MVLGVESSRWSCSEVIARASQEAAAACCRTFVLADEDHSNASTADCARCQHLSLDHAPTELLSADRVYRICSLQRLHMFVSIEVC